MVKEFVLNHMVMCIILMVGTVSLLLQFFMTLSLKGYVKASANMKTTKKKIMLNLKSQFEAIYSMDCQVHNAAAYVDKYLLKLRFLGLPYTVWERVPFLTAGIVSVIAAGGAFYEYANGRKLMAQAEILYAYILVLACLFVCFHIFGIKSRKQQIQIQLVDYLENYLSNRLTRTAAGSEQEDDMMMLRRLLSQMEGGESRAYTKMQAEKEGNQIHGEPDLPGQQIAAAKEAETDEMDPEIIEAFVKEQSDLELLEEFVQSFLA